MKHGVRVPTLTPWSDHSGQNDSDVVMTAV
jgi:hypothetical protein